jgi:outer membrane immunogenic protein
MRKLAFGASALVFLAVGPAMAADLAKRAVYKAPPPPPVVVYNWTGCYVGGNVGGAWQKTDNTLVVTNGVPPYFNPLVLAEVSRNGSGTLESSGWIGGFQVGCNYQASNIVWGIETDFNWMHQSDNFGGRFLYSTNGAPYFLDASDDKKWLWTLRGRIGLTVTDRVLLYVTGGFAAIRLDFTQNFSEPGFALPETASFSKTKGGWTVGGGIEAGLWDNWTVKAEYLYAQFDGETVTGVVRDAGGVGRTSTFTNTFADIHLHIARVGLNYRFGSFGVPVVARN